MKKLDEIPKKSVFEVPEGYFDRLPGIIQARVAPIAIGTKQEPQWILYFRFGLRYALPVLVIGVASFFFLNNPQTLSAEELIASVDSAHLVAYLEDSDLNSDDLLEIVPLDQEEAESIHGRSIDELKVNDEDVEYLSNEFGTDYF